MQGKSIRKILISGLHNHLDIDIDLNPGLNVIYGKNGKGKTTVLHILANILELDFKRFIYLTFNKIDIYSFSDNLLEIIKFDEHYLVVKYNGLEVGTRNEGQAAPQLSESECEVISEAFGGRPIYLPAYRAILERVKASPYEQPNAEFESIKKSELASLNKARLAGYSWRSQEQRAGLIARKTLQCRDWFGAFVPIIRYPALAEVVESITDEFTDAQMEASQSERRMLSSTFIEVFKSLVSTYDTPSDGEVEPLIARVRNALDVEDDTANAYPDHLGRSLAEELADAKIYSSTQESAAQKRVLKLYAELLEKRKSEKLQSFQKIRNFESAVNRFLDQKKFRVSNRGIDHRRNYVYIETDTKSFYPVSTLSSGERQILTMLFSATRMSTLATGVFLIDEPELSLHVDWQRIILKEISTQAPMRQIIACTHSPEVGADHDDAVQMFAPVFSSSSDGPSAPAQDGFLDELL